MKKLSPRTAGSAAAILAGGVLFTGPAQAVVIFQENFDGGSGNNAFAMPTYAYSLNYTQPNSLPPAGGGTAYGFGASGVINAFPGGTYSLLAGGVSAALIDAGLVSYNFTAQFSTYLNQQDFGQLSIQFLDSTNTPIDNPLLLGSQALVDGLVRSPNARFANAAAWGQETLTGQVPPQARSISLVLTEFKDANGAVIDGYTDNIFLSVNVVPEPGTVTLSGLVAVALLRRRRRA